MQLEFSFGSSRNIDIFDRKTRSTFTVPAAFCDDLKGCGSETHTRGNLAFSVNARVDCENPSPFLQFSYSGLVYRGLEQSLYSFNGSPSSVTVNTDIAKVIELALVPGTPAASNVAEALGLTTGETVTKVLGPQIIVTKASNKNRVIATIQRPIQQIPIDNCNLETGFKTSTSVSVFGFDTESCQATTLWQASVSLFASTYGYPADYTTISADIVDNLGVEAILSAADDSACNELQNLVEQPWANLIGTDITIGVA